MNGNRPLLTYAQSRTLDLDTIAAGFTEQQLMGQAAVASVNCLLSDGTLDSHETILILCGKGNNGGDGYAIAWALIGGGFSSRVQIFAAEPPSSQSALFYRRMCEEHTPIQDLTHFAQKASGPGDLILECLLGSGQKGDLRPPYLESAMDIARACKRGATLIAVDCPVGLTEERTASFGEELPLPDEVHCYGPIKLAAALNVSLATGSLVRSLPIGFEPVESSAWLWDGPPVQFHKSSIDHKYSAGSAAILGGEPGMEGAAILASDSFFAAGGGICEVLTTSAESRSRILSARPSLMVRELEEGIHVRAKAILAGPGIRLDDQKAAQILKILSSLPAETKVILDASTAELVRDSRYPALLKPGTVLTPHGGEWKKMGGQVPDSVQAFEESQALARKLGVSVLVKGPVSVLFSGKTWIHGHPNPSLAVAGSGDCLGGIILSSLSRGHEMAAGVLSSMDLLHEAVSGLTHPEAHEFAENIRRILSVTRA